MDMLYLAKRDVENLGITMAQVLQVLNEGLHSKGVGKVQMPPKSVVRPATDSFLEAMPVYIEDSETCGVKWMSGYKSNREKGIPYINGLLVLNDASTGVPIAVMDCTEITAIRTGAIVGIEAKHLARPDSSVVGILGCGVQARKSLIALSDALPTLSLVRCYDVIPQAAASFVSDMEEMFPLTNFVISSSPADMAHFCDVVVSAIPIADEPNPSLHEGMLKEGGLAISLDYDAAWSVDAMNACDKIVADDVEQLATIREQGLHFAGMPGDIYADLGEIVAGMKPGRQNGEERILCLNLGISLADVVVAAMIYDRAVRSNLGTRLPL